MKHSTQPQNEDKVKEFSPYSFLLLIDILRTKKKEKKSKIELHKKV